MELKTKLLAGSGEQPSHLRAASTCSWQSNGLEEFSGNAERQACSAVLSGGHNEKPKLALNSTASATSMQSVIKMLGE